MITLMLKFNHVISQHGWILLQMTNTLPSCVISYSHNQTHYFVSQQFKTTIRTTHQSFTNISPNGPIYPPRNHQLQGKNPGLKNRGLYPLVLSNIPMTPIIYGLYGIFTGHPDLPFRPIMVAEFFSPYNKALSYFARRNKSPRRPAERKNLETVAVQGV